MEIQTSILNKSISIETKVFKKLLQEGEVLLHIDKNSEGYLFKGSSYVILTVVEKNNGIKIKSVEFPIKHLMEWKIGLSTDKEFMDKVQKYLV